MSPTIFASRHRFRSRLAYTLLLVLLILSIGPGLFFGSTAVLRARGLLSQQANTFAVFFFILTSGLLGLVSWKIFRRLIRSICETADKIQLFTEGNWDLRAPVEQDETGLLSHSFNLMADEVMGLIHSLEAAGQERSYQLQVAAESSQIAISSSGLDELLRRTVNLIAERFAYSFTGIFLIDETGNLAELRHTAGVPNPPNKIPGQILRIDATTPLGWVRSFNQSKLVTPEQEDNLSEPRPELYIPISIGSQVLGILDIQSTNLAAFDAENISNLQTLVNQIAPSIHSFHLLEASQDNPQDISLLYQASRQIAAAASTSQVFELVIQFLQQMSYDFMIFIADRDGFRVIYPANFRSDASPHPNWLPTPPSEIEDQCSSSSTPVIFAGADPLPDLHPTLVEISRQQNWGSAAFLPVFRSNHIAAFMMLGILQKNTSHCKPFSSCILNPYLNLAEMMVTALEKVQARQETTRRLVELETLAQVIKAFSLETDVHSLYRIIHEQVCQVLGEVDFLIALVNPAKDLIQIPYRFVGDEFLTIPPSPLGEGLISILIHSGQPLVLDEKVENHNRALTGIVSEVPAQSWLGVPLSIGGEVIGAMVVEDRSHEHRFDEEDQRLLSTLASQVAVGLRNIQLLEETQRTAAHDRIVAGVSQKIRASSDMETILRTTLQELAQSLGASEGLIQLEIQEE